MEFFKIITEFSTIPKTDDITLDFFNFLEQNYPITYNKLSMFYSDNTSHDMDVNPRIALYDWDDLLKKENFNKFLFAIHHNWNDFTSQEYICCRCKDPLEFACKEHKLYNSYEDHISISSYTHLGFDGAYFEENLYCRSCIVKRFKKIIEKIELDEDGVNFYV